MLDGRREPELGSHDADYGAWVAVQAHFARDNGWISAESRAPDRVAEDHDRWSAGLEFARIERAAQARHEADDSQEIPADAQATHGSGRCAAQPRLLRAVARE